MAQITRALVIIDLQNEFLAPDGRYPIVDSSKQTLLNHLTNLVPQFRLSGHIIWVKSVYDNAPLSDSASAPDGHHDRDAYLRGTHTGKTPCCPAGSRNAEIYPTAQAMIEESDTIMVKTNYSAFNDTTLYKILRDRHINEVYFCGLLSSTCVLATLMDAVQTVGLSNFAVTDCLGWRNDKSHARALERMKDMGAKLVDSKIAAKRVPTPAVLDMPELYYVNGSIPSWRVQIALYEKGIKTNQIRMKVMSNPKPTRLPSFLALNHRGKTPVFIDNDSECTTVNESLAVLMYLETYYPAVPLLPPLEQRKYRARILSLVQETENLHNSYDALEDAFFEARESGTMVEFQERGRAKLLQSLYKELGFWEVYAANSQGWIGGGDLELTMADCAFYPILGYMIRRGLVLNERWPGLKRYQAHAWSRNSVVLAQPEGWNGKGNADVFRGS